MSDFVPVIPLFPRSGGAASPVSPSELLRVLLLLDLPAELIPGGVAVGPVSDAQIQAGCISLMDAGMPQREVDAPLVRVRAQLRCLAPTLSEVDRIVRGAWDRLHQRPRMVVRQDSSGVEYLVHWIQVGAGPSMHRDSDENFETLLFVELLIGLEPVSGA